MAHIFEESSHNLLELLGSGGHGMGHVKSVALSSPNLLMVAWDEGQVGENVLGFGVTWALSYYSSSGRFSSCGHWAFSGSPREDTQGKGKIKSHGCRSKNAVTSEKVLVAALKEPLPSVLAE